MDLRQLEYVIGVIDHGGFGRAATALHVTQPALSQGIRTLEAELGIDLFHRVGRGVVVSAAGETFSVHARAALRDATSAWEAVAAVRGLAAGRLDLVALPTLIAEPVARWVGELRRRHPGVGVRIAEPEGADEVAELVRSGSCDVGLADLRVPGDDLIAEPLLEQEVLAVCPPATPIGSRGVISVAQLARLPLVMAPPGTSMRRLLTDALAGVGVEPTIAVETRQREAIIPLVLAGAGVSLLPEALAADARTRGAVVARVRPRLRRTVGLVRRPAALSPAAAAFIEVARGP